MRFRTVFRQPLKESLRRDRTPAQGAAWFGTCGVRRGLALV